MSVLGWIFLATSLAFVWGLTIFCYYRVLAAHEDPPEPVRHFHSA